MSGLVQISYLQLVLASSLVVAAGIAAAIMRLGITTRLGIAVARMVVQLSLLGALLVWVFSLSNMYLVLAVLASMLINAGIAAVRRTEFRFPGVWLSSLFAVAVASTITMTLVLTVVVSVEPWYQPRYIIPLLGMVLGNSLTGLSLSMDRLMTELKNKRAEIELWLSCGASIFEACRPSIQASVRTGLIPIINSMSVAGIVSLPGMMTGQILAGSPPQDAVKYQILVMFMIAGAVAVSSLVAVWLCFRLLITDRHQLATHRLRHPH